MSLNDLTLSYIILVAVLIAALLWDMRMRIIPNALTLPASIWGLAIFFFTRGVEGLRLSLLGFALGIVLLFIPFVMGGIGGGDVKLLGAVGALKGPAFVFNAALYSAVIGGVFALLYLIAYRRLLATVQGVAKRALSLICRMLAFRLRSSYLDQLGRYYLLTSESVQGKESLYFPYGAAIVLGALLVLSGLVKPIWPL